MAATSVANSPSERRSAVCYASEVISHCHNAESAPSSSHRMTTTVDGDRSMAATLPPSEAPRTQPALTLTLLSDTFAVCRLDAGEVVPVWAWTGEVACVTRTRDELSIVCRADLVPAEV